MVSEIRWRTYSVVKVVSVLRSVLHPLGLGYQGATDKTSKLPRKYRPPAFTVPHYWSR